MTIRRSPAPFLLLLLLGGCAPSARERYGGEARYAPSFHSYVVGTGPHPALLRDPLTESKIQCRERLEEVAPALARALEDRIEDRHWTLVSRAALLPVSLPGYALYHAGVGMFVVAAGPSLLLTSPSQRTLYEEAGKAFTAQRWGQAGELYERALARRFDSVVEDSSPLLRDQILYYLGASRERSGDRGAAREAYQSFLDQGAWESEEAYRDAEAGLVRLGAPPPACRSREPLAMPWKEASR
jgi:hypothetical protein